MQLHLPWVLALVILSISKPDADKWEGTENGAVSKVKDSESAFGWDWRVTASSVDPEEISGLVRMARKWLHKEKV